MEFFVELVPLLISPQQLNAMGLPSNAPVAHSMSCTASCMIYSRGRRRCRLKKAGHFGASTSPRDPRWKTSEGQMQAWCGTT